MSQPTPEQIARESGNCKYHPDRVAHRIVGHGHGKLCEECWKLLCIGKNPASAAMAAKTDSSVQKPPVVKEVEPRKERSRTKMGKQIDEQTREAMKKDFADGMNINAVANKHQVSWACARDVVANNKRGRGKDAHGSGIVPLQATGVAPPPVIAPSRNHVRFVMLDAELNTGDLSQLTQAVITALRGGGKAAE